MKIVGIIPARGGSKGIKNKNLVTFNKKPLIYWTIKAAKESKLLNNFYVSTEDPNIKKISLKFGSKVIDRPKRLARDASTTLSVLQHSIKITDADVIVCLQPTSPIRPRGIIDKAIKIYIKNKSDTLATGRILHNYEWGKFNNVSRQKLKGWFWDDGLLYIMKSNQLLKNQWSGKKLYKMEIDKIYNLLEIDDQSDLEILRKLIKFNNYD
jgi:N-acylneuraminate cytidylyltransferase